MAIIRIDDATGEEKEISYQQFCREIKEDFGWAVLVFKQMRETGNEAMGSQANYRYVAE